MSRALLGAAIMAALLVAGCGEPEQVVVYKQGKYQGKPDTRAWDNAPLAAEQRGGNWTKGDRASWETQIKNRQLAQHEHKRIYQ
jgi:outer membrane murein-binding lipoprotein Lpp